MKVIVPDYYKNFKCIAGACEDTCCAGWEVDVDEESYQRYKQTGGSIGARLRELMIPKKEGEGCSFRLTPDKRCPFLNEKNLCDIYTEMGEDALCDTCTYFPRFVHDYGSFREMGPAPSCFTAAQLMVAKQGETKLVSYEDKSIQVQPNDICPEAFFMLQDLRSEIFRELWDEESGLHLHKRLVRILDKAYEKEQELVHMLDIYSTEVHEACCLYEENRNACLCRDEDEFSSKEGSYQAYCKAMLKGGVASGPDKHKMDGRKNNAGGKDTSSRNNDVISLWLDPFSGMETINNDWTKLLGIHGDFCAVCPDEAGKEKACRAFEANVTFAKGAFKQLLFYYFFRYILEAVHDGRLLCAVKTGIVAYLTVRRLCVASYYKSGGLTEDKMADIFHLYSRQIEHSEVNFEHYRRAYDRDAEYDAKELKKLLSMILYR